MKSNLYELTEAWKNIQELVDDEETPFEQLESAIKNIDQALEEKADGYAKIIRMLEGEAAAIKAEETRLSGMRKAKENRIMALKKSLEEAMITTGKKKFKTTLFGFNVQRNPPSVSVQDEDKIPEEYWRVQRSLNRRDILAALRDGKEIPGAEIISTESLRIR